MSNLLKDASILLTPTAYENGRMNAIKPSKDLYGSELVTNGDFATDSNWTKGTGWSISNGKASCDGVSFGNYLSQTSASTLILGKTYKVSFDLEYTSGTLFCLIGSSNPSTNTSGNITTGGSKEFYITISTLSDQLIYFRSNYFVGSIDNVSVVEDLSGDFDFERNSAATRVNAQGLVENVQILSPELVSNGNFSQIGTEEVLNGDFSQIGSELVTNGDFATDSDWTKGTGWSISGGKANVNSTSFTDLSQNIGAVVGKTYKISFEVSNYVSGSVKVILGYGSSPELPLLVATSNGVYEVETTPNAINPQNIYISTKTTNTQLSIDNVSVKEVGQNWTLGTGWSIGDDVAKVDNTSANYISQDGIVSDTKTYAITFTILNYISGSIRLRLGNTYGDYVSGDGTYTKYIQCTASNKFRVYSAPSGANLSITNISVKEVGQDWTLGTGWSIGDDEAIFNETTTNRIFQTGLSIISGKKYKIGFTIADCPTTAHMTIYDAGGSDLILPNENYVNGDYTRYYTATTNETGVSFWGNTAGDTFTISNISVKEITDDTNIPRINYEGFSYQDSLGSELITNGDFATDSNWILNNGTTISNGTANINGGGNVLEQVGGIFVSGKTFIIKFTISNYVNGSIAVSNVSPTTYRSANGTYTLTATGANGNFKFFSSGFIGSIDNVSVKEYLGQEVVPDSGCGSWLLEPQSTNLITYSEDFSDGDWSKISITVDSNQVTSPDGTQNADKLTKSASNSLIRQFITTSGANTFSVYVKKGSLSWVRLYIASSTESAECWFDLENGLTGKTSGNPDSVEIIGVNNGWYRCIITKNTTNINNFRIYPSQADDDTSGTSGYIYSWGAQVENQSYSTSYIPTNGATNTRLQDIANNSGNSSLINSTEGVLYADIAALANDGVPRKISLSDGDGNPQIALGYDAVSNQIRAIVFDGTFPVDVVLSTTNYDVLEYHKVAIKYKSGDSSLWVDGTEVQTSTNAFTITSALNNLNFDDGSGSSDFFGKNKALAVYKEALTDANLRCLTYPNPVATTFDLDFDTIAEQFTFTRGSEATFVNSQGLIESTNQLGPELVTNGDFATDSNWVKQTGWSIANGVATCDGTNLTQLYQTNVLTQNKLYKVTYSITSRTSGGVFAKLGDNILGAINSTVGTYTEYFNFTQANLSFHFRSSNFIGSIDNVSVKEVITATNTPRIDYSTGEKAFLLEPQSTNLYPYSQTVTSGGLTFFTGGSATATLTNNYSISPDGTQNALRFQATVLNNISSRAAVRNLLSTSAVMSTVSVYAKSNTNENYTMIFHYEGGVRDTFVVTPEWQRFSFSEVSAVTNNVGVELRGTYTSLEADVSLWGFQFENQSYATSLIPTSGASATRNQELCNNATPVINSEEGVLYAEIAALSSPVDSPKNITISDGTGNNYVRLEYYQNGKVYGNVFDGTNTTANFVVNQLNFNKVAVQYSSSGCKLYVNGVGVDFGAKTFPSNTLNTLQFSNAQNSASYFHGNIKDLKYYPKALADVQLEDLTTI